jgi:hypothetical protein
MTRRSTILLVLVAGLAAGCNAPPEGAGASLEPEQPTTLDDLELVLTKATDPNRKDEVGHEIYWFVDGTVVPELTGETWVSADLTAKGQEWVVEVTPADDKEAGATVSASVTIGNVAPTASVTIDPEAPLALDELVAAAVTDDVDADEVSLTWSWTRNGEPQSFEGPVVPADATTKGDRWEVTVVPNDGDEDGDAATAFVDVENVPPRVDQVVLTPDAPVEASLLETAVEGGDADGDQVTYTYVWTVDGVDLSDLPADQASLDGAWFDRDHAIYVTVTPNDGFVDGEPVASNTVVVGNTAPSITGASLDPTEIYEATTVTCVPDGWADDDGDSASYTFGWLVDGADLGVPGATLTGTYFDKGDALACVVTPTDGLDDGTPWTSDAVTVLNTLPVLASATLSSLTPVEGDTLSVTLGATSDDDSDTVTVSTEWFVNGASVSTDSTLDSGSFAKGDTIYAVLTPNDGEADGASVTTGTATVQNSAPVGTAVSLSPDPVRVGDTLTATPSGTDADGDTISWTYVWTVDGTTVAETSASIAGGTYFSSGQVVSVSATPSDGSDAGTAITASITVSNTAPSATSASIDPTEIYEGSTASCVPDGWADADGDAEGYDYAWTVNGTSIASTSSALTGSDFDKDDVLVCEATPNDGTDTGTAVTSASVTVLNTPPVLASAALSSTSPVEGDTLSVTLGADSDDDGDSVSHGFEWYVSGSMVATTPELTSADFARGDTIYAVVTPNDGDDDGTPVTTDTATVGNTAPVGVSVTLTPSSPSVSDTLTASASGTDADGDSLTWAYAWTVDGVAVSPTTSTLSSTYFGKGEVVIVTATPSDGTDTGSSVTSSSVTVANTPPTAPGASIDPSEPGPDDDLVCLVTASTDADGDSITYSVDWTLNGSAWTGSTSTTTHTGDTILSADTAELDEFTCTVTPNDGEDDGTATTSDSVTVGELLTVDGTTTTLTTGTYDYAAVEIINGGTLIIDGLVEINAVSFTLDASSSIDGVGLGNAIGSGSGAGASGVNGGGGGGAYGGAGGNGGYDSGDTVGLGGSTYGDISSADIDMGSGGANGADGGSAGGAGGAGLFLYAETIDIAGDIDVSGDPGEVVNSVGRCGGGGSGGGILVWGDDVTLSGTLTVDGGHGGNGAVGSGNDGGGGGGGGRIKVLYDSSLTDTSTQSVSGGALGTAGSIASEAGDDGTTFESSVTWPGL